MQASPEYYRRYRQTPVPYKRSKACTYGTSICSLADDGTPFEIGDFSVHRHKVQIPIFYFLFFFTVIIIYLSVFIKQRLPGKGIVVYGIWISLFCLTLVQTSLFLFQLCLLTSQRSVYAVYDSYKRQVHLVCNLLGGVALGVQVAWCTIIVVHAALFCISLARINQLNILNAMLAKRFNPFLFHVAFAVYLVLHVHYLYTGAMPVMLSLLFVAVEQYL